MNLAVYGIKLAVIMRLERWIGYYFELSNHKTTVDREVLKPLAVADIDNYPIVGYDMKVVVNHLREEKCYINIPYELIQAGERP